MSDGASRGGGKFYVVAMLASLKKKRDTLKLEKEKDIKISTRLNQMLSNCSKIRMT